MTTETLKPFNVSVREPNDLDRLDELAQNKLAIIESCDDCGACCTHVGHPMFLFNGRNYGIERVPPTLLDACVDNDEPAWTTLPDDLKALHVEYIKSLQKVDDGQPCYWLDLETRKCIHHEHRPDVCREFEMGGEDCRSARKEHEITKAEPFSKENDDARARRSFDQDGCVLGCL